MQVIKNLNEALKKPTVVALGYFDGLHRGHKTVIEAAAEAAGHFCAATTVLSFDMSALRAGGKGAFDITTRQQKLEAVASTGVVQYVELDFADIAPLSGRQFVEQVLSAQLDARCVCCGADFRFGNNRQCGIAELKDFGLAAGIETVIVPDIYYQGAPVSSTRVKAALERGDIEFALAMLGRPYEFALPVFRDKRLATKLGFPTINQRFPEGILVPRFGVYYTRVFVDGAQYAGVTNLGVRPSVNHDGKVTIETHLLDFDGDLYDRELTVRFLHFLRDEQRFGSIDALRRAVEYDIEIVRGLEKSRNGGRVDL